MKSGRLAMTTSYDFHVWSFDSSLEGFKYSFSGFFHILGV
tara:strand:- start:127 stop:246 length:120 start_codon:yes stop_codon:yes gene_type:complete